MSTALRSAAEPRFDQYPDAAIELCAYRIRGAVITALTGTPFVEIEEFISPQERECWTAIARTLIHISHALARTL